MILNFRILLITLLLITVSACTTPKRKDYGVSGDSAPSKAVDWTTVKQVHPKKEPKSKYGNPKTYEVFGKTYRVLNSSENFKQHGVASWYGTQFHGRRTSSGETYDMLQLTAAHKTLPIPCYVKVTNKDNGKTLIVRVNDRGPFAKSRIIDLSYSAAYQLGMAKKGTANVMIETISFNQKSGYQNKKAPNKAVKKKIVQKKQGKYRFVQVGAYSNHVSAQKLAKVLDREIKLPVKISSIIRKGKKLYRVRIGPINDLTLAEKLSKILDIKELGKPSIVYQD